MPRADSPYNHAYERRRALLLASHPSCVLMLRCEGDPATSLDHDPPLSRHTHVEGSGCCVERPACEPCQRFQGGSLRAGRDELLVSRQLPEPSREWL
jgi:hypothetical protein